MRAKRAFLCLTVIIALSFSAGIAYSGDALMKTAQGMFKPIPETPPALNKNPLTPEKMNLGKMLYFDPRLSKSGLISCNTCHNIGLGGADFHETSIGHGWQKGGRNAPTVLNAIYNIAQFWDGRAPDLMEQAKGPIQAGVEMNNTQENVIKTLKSMPEYMSMFIKAFPGDNNPTSFNNMAKAIEVFEATLITPGSRFDNYLKGDEKALTKYEKSGLKLYINKGCGSCHGGINMGGAGYFPFGVKERPKEEITGGDTGRFKVTGTMSDQYVFKAPSLRNIELTPPYFHSGKIWSMESAVAIMGSSQLGISLTRKEIEAVSGFLKTTTGVQPKVEYPILPVPTSETPLPVTD